jgi:RNA polymerase sigma factor (sigma-70 family)
LADIVPKEEFAQQLVSLQPRLLWFIASRVDDDATQEDLLSRVNERALNRFDAGDIQRVEQFVFGIARNVLHEHWREIKRRRAVEVRLTETAENYAPPRDATTITGIKSRTWLLRSLQQCLEQLPAADQSLARDAYRIGKSKENRSALAEKLGITRNTLDARLSRIRRRLDLCVQAKLAARFAQDEARRKAKSTMVGASQQ